MHKATNNIKTIKRSTIDSAPPEQFWTTLKKGDQQALQKLYDLYANALFNYGSKFSMDHDLIKDCIQELFMTLWLRKDFLGTPANVKNYLYKAFRLLLFKDSKMIQQNVTYEELGYYDFDATLNIEESTIEGENIQLVQQRLQQKLNQLSSRQREAIFLKFYEGLNYDEIAEVMDISVKGSYKLMARALDSLRGMLSKDDFLLILFYFSTKFYH